MAFRHFDSGGKEKISAVRVDPAGRDVVKDVTVLNEQTASQRELWTSRQRSYVGREGESRHSKSIGIPANLIQ